MNEIQVREAFDYINRLGDYQCHQTEIGNDFISFAAEADVQLLRRERVIIDATFYFEQNTAVFVMLISEGFWGDKLYLVDSLLMQINSITRAGAFAYWPNTNEVVFKNDFPIDYLDQNKILQILRYFEQVFIGVKPTLESYASDWGLQYISESQKTQLARDLEWHYRGMETKFLE